MPTSWFDQIDSGQGGGLKPQVIVPGPNGWYRPTPGAPWVGGTGEPPPNDWNPPSQGGTPINTPSAGSTPTGDGSTLTRGWQPSTGSGQTGTTPTDGGVTITTGTPYDPNNPTSGGARLTGPNGPPYNGDYQRWFMDLVQNLPANGDTLAGLEATLQKHGIRVERNAKGIAGKIVLPDGTWVDVGENFSGGQPGNMRWNWLTGGSSGGGGLGNLGSGASTQYAAGSAVAPWTKEWNMPTADQAMKFPGFQYAMDRAQQAIERSAASKGTLLTGGLLRDLSENQIGMGMQQYGNLYNWMKDDYLTDRDNFQQNQDRPFDKYYKLGALGKPA